PRHVRAATSGDDGGHTGPVGRGRAKAAARAVARLLARARAGPLRAGGAERGCRLGRPGRARAALAPSRITLARRGGPCRCGAELRFEALEGRYSWQGPPWALETERALRVLHPAGLRWQPALEGYSGDPYNYLVRAREMRGFYEPNVREPLFPFVTRQLLRLL